MLDFRAWIIAGLLILASAGAYVLWITRSRPAYNARSLSAPPKTATKMLHVEGCEKDFVVKPGELVEPRVLPGAAPDQFRALYGPETKPKKTKHPDSIPDAHNLLRWDLDPYTLTAVQRRAEKDVNKSDADQRDSNESAEAFVHLSVHPGHVVETLDGIELGIDSLGAILRKMQDRQIEVHQRTDRLDGNWILTISFDSDCGHRFRSEYSRMIPDTPESEQAIAPRTPTPGSANPPAGPRSPWDSALFMNKVVTEYSLVPATGTTGANGANGSR